MTDEQIDAMEAGPDLVDQLMAAAARIQFLEAENTILGDDLNEAARRMERAEMRNRELKADAARWRSLAEDAVYVPLEDESGCTTGDHECRWCYMRVGHSSDCPYQAAINAKPPYGDWCRDPQACDGKGYCPLDPTCGD